MISTLKHVARRLHSVAREHFKRLTRSPHWPVVERAHLAQHPECAACGGKEHLQVHHRLPFHLHPELELDPSNLLTLCMARDCEAHLLLGHGSNFRAFNPLADLDALEVRREPRKRPLVIARARIARRFE